MRVTQPHILIVDDEEACLSSLQRALRSHNHEWRLTATTDPRRALALVSEECVDVVVSDMMMPGLTGLELLNEIRVQAPDTVGMILTGSARLDTALEAINELEVFRYLEKPCPPHRLSSGIEAAVRHRENRLAMEHSPTEQADTYSQLTAALDHMAVGVAIVCEAGQIVFRNNSADSLLSEGDGLFVAPNNVLRASDTADNRLLIGCIEGAGSGRGGTIPIRRPSERRSLVVHALPLQEHPKRAMLFLVDPEVGRHISEALLTSVLELTTSEARLVRHLVAGASITEAAAECGVTESTARTYLKTVFCKTGATRQADLVGLVLSAGAGLPTMDFPPPESMATV